MVIPTIKCAKVIEEKMKKGIRYTCESCGYEEFFAIGNKSGFDILRNMYVCADCRSLVDLSESYDENEGHGSQSNLSRLDIVSDKLENDSNLELIKSLPKEDQDFLAQVFGIGICEHRNLEAWDQLKKPCPKCAAKMENIYTLGFVELD